MMVGHGMGAITLDHASGVNGHSGALGDMLLDGTLRAKGGRGGAEGEAEMRSSHSARQQNNNRPADANTHLLKHDVGGLVLHNVDRGFACGRVRCRKRGWGARQCGEIKLERI